jgi:hypothetical protein
VSRARRTVFRVGIVACGTVYSGVTNGATDTLILM